MCLGCFLSRFLYGFPIKHSGLVLVTAISVTIQRPCKHISRQGFLNTGFQVFVDDIRHVLYLGHLVGCEINDITFHSKGEAVSLDVSVDDFILFDYFSAVLESV